MNIQKPYHQINFGQLEYVIDPKDGSGRSIATLRLKDFVAPPKDARIATNEMALRVVMAMIDVAKKEMLANKVQAFPDYICHGLERNWVQNYFSHIFPQVLPSLLKKSDDVPFSLNITFEGHHTPGYIETVRDLRLHIDVMFVIPDYTHLIMAATTEEQYVESLGDGSISQRSSL